MGEFWNLAYGDWLMKIFENKRLTGLGKKNRRGGFRFRGLYLPAGFPWRH